MCGLFGAAGNDLNNHDISAVKELGFLSALRGLDSTGVAFVFRKHGKQYRNVTSYSSMKSIDHSVDFLFQGNFDNSIKSFKNTLCVMGHTRAATVGSVSKDNAHPFSHMPIIGAHNGHIPKWAPEQRLKGRTDSERLFQEMAARSPLEALKLAGEDAHWAVSYLHTGKNELVLTRNLHRPLHYCQTIDGKKIFWASDPMFLELVIARYGDKIKFGAVSIVPIRHQLIWSFGNAKLREEEYSLATEDFRPWRLWDHKEKDEQHRCDATHKGGEDKAKEIEDAYFEEGPFKDQEEIELKRAKILPVLFDPPDKDKVQPINMYVNNVDVSANSVETASSVFNGAIPWAGYPRILILNEHRKMLQFINWSGRFIGQTELNVSTKHGCMICGKLPTLDDKIWWLNGNLFVFDDYIGDPLVQAHLKSNNIVPRLGRGIYVSPRLLLDARHQMKEDAIYNLKLAEDQLGTYFDPAFNDGDDWEDEEVVCH